MARPRLPSHLKVVTGTTDARRVNRAEPKPPVRIPPMPPGLSRKAQDAWNRTAPLLERMGVLTDMDAMALEQLCIVYGVLMTAKDALDDFGDFSYSTKSESGPEMRRAHPEVAVYFEALRQFNNMLGSFGMTPSSRSKVSISPLKEVDPLDHFFTR